MFFYKQPQMSLRRFAVACAVLAFALPASAGTPGSPVPHTFSNGTTADATQVNANFSELQSQIAQLQTQLAALQPQPPAQAILGVYDFVGFYTETDTNNGCLNAFHCIWSGAGRGYITFTADGAVTFNSSWSFQVFSTTEDPGHEHWVGSESETVQDVGTYTISGSTVTIDIPLDDFDFQGTVSPDGKTLILRRTTADDGILVGVKR